MKWWLVFVVVKILSVFFLPELFGQNSVIYGKVIDSNTGERLSEVSLTLKNGDNIMIESKMIKGENYSFVVQKTGSYKLEVGKNEYDTVFEDITVLFEDSLRRDVVLKRPPKFLCIIKVNGQDCKDILKEVDINTSGNLFRFALFNSGYVPLKWIVSKNCEWISVSSSESNATNGTLDSEGKENMTVIIDPEKLEAGKTTGKILVLSNNGNAVLSIKAVGKYPDIIMLPIEGLFPDTFKAQIDFKGRHTYQEMGFCFSYINENPTISDEYVLANDLGAFSYKRVFERTSYILPWYRVFMDENDVCKTYYVRAFLKYENGTIIYSSNVEKFTLWKHSTK